MCVQQQLGEGPHPACLHCGPVGATLTALLAASVTARARPLRWRHRRSSESRAGQHHNPGAQTTTHTPGRPAGRATRSRRVDSPRGAPHAERARAGALPFRVAWCESATFCARLCGGRAHAGRPRRQGGVVLVHVSEQLVELLPPLLDARRGLGWALYRGGLLRSGRRDCVRRRWQVAPRAQHGVERREGLVRHACQIPPVPRVERWGRGGASSEASSATTDGWSVSRYWLMRLRYAGTAPDRLAPPATRPRTPHPRHGRWTSG